MIAQNQAACLQKIEEALHFFENQLKSLGTDAERGGIDWLIENESSEVEGPVRRKRSALGIHIKPNLIGMR